MDDENTVVDPVDDVPSDGGDPVDSSPVEETVQVEQPDPEPDPTPVQVISVDELLERLTSTGEAEPEQAQEEQQPELEPEETVPANGLTLAEEYYNFSMSDTTDSDTLATVQSILTEIREEREVQAPHALMTTSFEDYTVLEGLLLLSLIFGVIKACVSMLKGGFRWLLW